MQLIANGTQGGLSVPTKQTPVGTPGYANSGTPGSFSPTVFDPDMGNTLIAEIVAVVLASGQTLSASNNTQLLTAIQSVPTGRLLNIQVFNTAGTFTYTPTSGTNTIDGDIVAGGGGGGGTTTTGAGTVSSGGGGGSGARAKFKVSSPTTTTVTIGAGGTGGAVAGGMGGTGGTSSFGTLAVVSGGTGGQGGAATAGPGFSSTGGGGTTITGSAVYISRKGDQGSPASIYSTAANISGAGASSLYGAGGGPSGVIGTGAYAGQNASGNGSGGAGASISVSSTAQIGGAGSPGICIIYEYS
jgi:hypothetical protein